MSESLRFNSDGLFKSFDLKESIFNAPILTI